MRKVVNRKDELLKELEENGFVENMLEDTEYFDKFDPNDDNNVSCVFCGGKTKDGDILCPKCANNVD